MKKTAYAIIFLLFPFFALAQLTENFTDGDFTSNPSWTGDTTLWQVVSNALNSNSQTPSSTFYLSTPASTSNNMEWKLYMNLKFSTSSANYVDIYLMSDVADLTSPGNGYFVRVGNTADEISLYRQDAGSAVKIIDGIDGRSQASSSDNKIHLKITRSLTNDWQLFDDNTGTGLNYISEGLINDATYPGGSYFGISVTQSTPSFFSKHFFDDISVGPIPVDINPPAISSIIAISQNQVDITFSEPVELTSAQDVINYSVNNGIGSPASAVIDGANPAIIHLTFLTTFPSWVLQTISITNVKDYANNTATLLTGTFMYFETFPADSGDVVINEILFNPKPNGFDYVEIYNKSQKAIDLESINISGADLISDLLYGTTSLVQSKSILLPDEYAVFTENSLDITSKYNVKFPGNLYEILNLPTYTDNEGIVVLTNLSGKRLDQFHYIDSYHFPLLKDVEGVSLERLSYGRPSNDPSNWHSASETENFGTPTYKNSESADGIASGSSFTVSPQIFSPDGDGYNDIVNIQYSFDKPEQVANINIYDSRGRIVRKLVRNQLLGNTGTFSWDGITEDRNKAPIGIYVIFIELFDVDGKVTKNKKTCILGGKF